MDIFYNTLITVNKKLDIGLRCENKFYYVDFIVPYDNESVASNIFKISSFKFFEEHVTEQELNNIKNMNENEINLLILNKIIALFINSVK